MRPTATIAQKSRADRLLLVACSAYVCWTCLIEQAAPPVDDALVAYLVKLGALIALGLAMWAVATIALRAGRRRAEPANTVLAWAPVTAAILACLAHLVVYHGADNTSIIIAAVIGATMGWRQTLLIRELKAYARDLAERESTFRRLAHTDALTGLGNRRALDYVLARETHPGSESIALFVDLDDFKAVNDASGHDVGDAVLREFANRVRADLRAGDSPPDSAVTSSSSSSGSVPRMPAWPRPGC